MNGRDDKNKNSDSTVMALFLFLLDAERIGMARCQASGRASGGILCHMESHEDPTAWCGRLQIYATMQSHGRWTARARHGLVPERWVMGDIEWSARAGRVRELAAVMAAVIGATRCDRGLGRAAEKKHSPIGKRAGPVT